MGVFLLSVRAPSTLHDHTHGGRALSALLGLSPHATMSPRRAPRIDGSQPAIIAALRAQGASVCSLAGCADGVPDLVIGWRGRTYLAEVKDGAKPPSRRSLTPAQREWHAAWRGQVVILSTVADATAWLDACDTAILAAR